ncbi:MAG: response regulator transcription factor [Bacteroidales bacterium]|nr:response regulator transcription factor [Bacteroidales bacterium]MCF8403144.1 response regulator transcription factor [Bacteroidales bacterium]
MHKAILIIHPSEIVRKGLNAILRTYFNVEIIMLPQLDGLHTYAKIEQSLLILFTPFLDKDETKWIRKLKKDKLVKWVLITDDGFNSELNCGPDFTFPMNTSSSDIQQLVQELIKIPDHHAEGQDTNSELTSREKDVLKLVALGYSNKEIADQLFISSHTVISHRKNITEKLGIKSISGLTVYAILNKIIDTDTINIENLI